MYYLGAWILFLSQESLNPFKGTLEGTLFGYMEHQGHLQALQLTPPCKDLLREQQQYGAIEAQMQGQMPPQEYPTAESRLSLQIVRT